MGTITRESLNRQIESSSVVNKYSKRIGLLEEARKVSGVKPMSAYDKYYTAQLFENINKGTALKEGYSQITGIAGNGFKRTALNIVSLAVQNTVLPDIVEVAPMESMAAMVPVMQITAGKTKGAVKEGDVIIDNTGVGSTDAYQDGRFVKDQALEKGAKSIVAPFTPIVPGSVKVVAGTTVITDDGKGALTDGGKVDYTNGTIELNAATTEDGTISYEYSNEIVPTTTQNINLSINPVPLLAQEHKLSAFYGITAAYALNKEYGISAPMVFEQQAANEINKEQERLVMRDIFGNAAGGNDIVWSATARPGVAEVDHIEELPIAINLAAAKIYQRTAGNLAAGFVVAGSNVVAYLQKSKSFVANEVPQNGGSYLAGTLGTLKVYATVGIEPNDFFVGARGNDFWQAGYVVGNYMPISNTSVVTTADFTSQEGFVSVYANKMINSKLYVRGRITV